MTATAITPTPTQTVTPVSLTGALVAAAASMQFPNSGREILYISVGSTPATLTVDVGSQVLGQAVTNFSESLSASTVYAVGPFPSALDQPGGAYDVQVAFSAVTDISVAVLQVLGTI